MEKTWIKYKKLLSVIYNKHVRKLKWLKRSSRTAHCWGQVSINYWRVATQIGTHSSDHYNGSTIACGQPLLSYKYGGWGHLLMNERWPRVTCSLLVCRIMDSSLWRWGLWERVELKVIMVRMDLLTVGGETFWVGMNSFLTNAPGPPSSARSIPITSHLFLCSWTIHIVLMIHLSKCLAHSVHSGWCF